MYWTNQMLSAGPTARCTRLLVSPLLRIHHRRRPDEPLERSGCERYRSEYKVTSLESIRFDDAMLCISLHRCDPGEGRDLQLRVAGWHHLLHGVDPPGRPIQLPLQLASFQGSCRRAQLFTLRQERNSEICQTSFHSAWSMKSCLIQVKSLSYL